jgi:hypothetical protein
VTDDGPAVAAASTDAVTDFHRRWAGQVAVEGPVAVVKAAFVFDPDGHNIEAVCHGPA